MNYQSLEKKSDKKLFINEYVSAYKYMLYSVDILSMVTRDSAVFTKPCPLFLFMCTCAPKCAHLCGNARVCISVWRPGVDVRCLPQFTFVF